MPVYLETRDGHSMDGDLALVVEVRPLSGFPFTAPLNSIVI